MGTVENLTIEEFESMTEEQKSEYCTACWDRTFASCPDCLIEHERKANKASRIQIKFAKDSEGSQDLRFVEVENDKGESISLGTWIKDDKGHLLLVIDK